MHQNFIRTSYNKRGGKIRIYFLIFEKLNLIDSYYKSCMYLNYHKIIFDAPKIIH